MSTENRRRRHAAHVEEHEGGMERWLLTYADMITLLLALFVVLFALSSINEKKFLEFKLGLTQTFNPSAVSLPGGDGVLEGPSLAGQEGSSTQLSQSGSPSLDTEGSTKVDDPQLRQIAAQLHSALAKKGLESYANVSLGSASVVVQILADRAFFATDSASLGTVGDRVVDAVASVVRTKPNAIEVQGFTDDQPIRGGIYTSNWELSGARAANVANRLNTVDKIAGTRLTASGYGDTHPAVPNTSAANMAKNRRIDVVILGVAAKSSTSEDASGSAAQTGGS